VIFPHYVLSNIPEYFPRPSEFLPERWLKKSADAAPEECPIHQDKIHPFASLPFSFGRRTCLGKRFAYLELHIMLSKVEIADFYIRKFYLTYFMVVFRFSESTKLNTTTVTSTTQSILPTFLNLHSNLDSLSEKIETRVFTS